MITYTGCISASEVTNPWVKSSSQMCFRLDGMLKKKKKFFESVVNIKKLEDIIQNPT